MTRRIEAADLDALRAGCERSKDLLGDGGAI